MRKILTLSVLLNMGLVAFVGYHFASRKELTKNEAEQSASKGSAKKYKAHRVSTVNETATNFLTQRFSWERVEAADYKEYIANLRAIGCPEETIRDIIIADVNKMYSKQLAPLRKPRADSEYWRTDMNWGGWNQSNEFYEKQQEIEKEKDALLKELLGANYQEEIQKQWGWYSEDAFSASLSPDTKAQLRKLQMEYGRRQSEIHRKARGHIDEEDQKEIRKIQKEMYDEMAKILPPDQLFEWQVRHSDIASNMKWNELQGFDANEAEFRAIFKMKLASESGRFDQASTDRASREARAAEIKQAEQELKAVLGEERYKEYKLSQDWEYRNLVQLAERQELPRTVAKQVFDMKADVEKAARDVRSAKDLTSAQRDEKLALIRAETEKAISEMLGEKGFKSYKRNAWWLRNIAPQKPPTPVAVSN